MIIDDFSNPKRKLTVSEASAANDYFTRRKSEEDRIAGIKAPAKNKKNPANTDYAKKRKQQDIEESRPFRGTGGAFNRGDDERHDIDSAREQQLAQYEQSGKFWLKYKDSQKHVNDTAYIGKAAARAAFQDLLRKHPELKGNLVMTAWGPGEQEVTEGEDDDSGTHSGNSPVPYMIQELFKTHGSQMSQYVRTGKIDPAFKEEMKKWVANTPWYDMPSGKPGTPAWHEGAEETLEIVMPHLAKRYWPKWLKMKEYHSPEQGVAEALTYPQKHSSWSVHSPKKNEFNTRYKLDQEPEARAHAERVGGKLVKVDQRGHAIRTGSKGDKGVAEGYSLKKTNVDKYMEPGDPDEYTQDINIKDTDYEIINNKTGQIVGTASWTTNDYFGPGALEITMKNGATRYLDIWEREKGNPQTAFNRFVKDPKTAKKYKEQGVAEGPLGTYVLNVMDAVTGEHWAIEIQASSPDMAKERAQQQGYKVLRIKEKGVAEGLKDKLAGAALAGSMAMGGAPAHAGFGADLAGSIASGLGSGMTSAAMAPSIYKEKNAADKAFAEQIPDEADKAKYLKGLKYIMNSRELANSGTTGMIQNTADEREFKKFKQRFATKYNIQIPTKEGVAEAGMPSSVIKNKQRNAEMSDKDFHAAHKDKSEDDLKAMAWRHGYGKGSTHYVDKHKKGQQGVAEGYGEDDGIHLGAKVYHKEHQSGEPFKVAKIIDDQRVGVIDDYGNKKVMFINQLVPAQGVAEGSLEEVSDKTLTNYLTKVDADSRKHRMDPTKRPAHKASKSIAGFATAFNKLDSPKKKPKPTEPEQGVAEAKNLKKRVKIVKGPDAGKTGWIREIKHGAFKGALKSYYIDLDDGGQANNLPGAALRLIKDQSLSENAEDLHVGDPVIITGNGIKFEGATGEIVDFGRDNRFVVVNLYNHGRHSFHSSDVSFNEYAGSDDEEARMYDAGEFGDDPRDEMDEARMSAAQRLSNAWDRQRAKSDASLRRTPSSIPKTVDKERMIRDIATSDASPEHKKVAIDAVMKTMSESRVQRQQLLAKMLNGR